MRLISLIAGTFAALALSACGNGFSTPSQGLSSLSTPTPTPSPAPTELSQDQMTTTETSLANLIGQLFVSLQSLNQINFSLSNQTVNASASVNCPSGGSVSVIGQATADLSFSGFTMNAAFTQTGNASLTFYQCQLPGSITLNGTINVSSLTGNMSFAYDATQGSGTITAQGSDQAVGSLQVSAGSVNVSCPLTVTSSVNINGSGGFSSGSTAFSTSGNGTASINGSFCNQSVSQQNTFTL